jgi:hypothetical protein
MMVNKVKNWRALYETEKNMIDILKPAESTMAYLKAGLLGFNGSGKTFTAKEIAIGLHGYIKSTKPIFFIDTETGSDFMIPAFKRAGIEMLVAKTRAFADVIQILKDTDGQCDIGIIDSITHVWRELCEAYKKKKHTNRLYFQHWAELKDEWQRFTDLYVNCNTHLILCGRAGYEYDYFENEEGKKELMKTGTKMKVETEFGFEPSLLIEMDRMKKATPKNPELKGWTHRATILKDRTDMIDGEQFDDPKFEVFLPHITNLNIGGKHLGVDIERTSEREFDNNGNTERQRRVKDVAIALEEIQGEITSMFPGTTNAEKKAKIDLVVALFETRSWTAVEGKSLEELKAGLSVLKPIAEAYGRSQVDGTYSPELWVELLVDARDKVVLGHQQLVEAMQNAETDKN